MQASLIGGEAAPLPQANDLCTVAAVVDAIAAGLDTTGDIAEAIGMANRQGAYYPNAACTLSYVSSSGEHKTTWRLTEEGLRFVRMTADQRASDMARAITEYSQVEAYGREGAGSLEKHYLLEGLSETTAKRRVGTVATWYAWAQNAGSADVVDGIGEASEATKLRAPEVLAARKAAEAASRPPAPAVCRTCYIQMPSSGVCDFC